MYMRCSSTPALAILHRSASIACRPQGSCLSSPYYSPNARCFSSLVAKGSIFTRGPPSCRMVIRPALFFRSKSSKQSQEMSETIIFLPNREISIADLASRLPKSSPGDVMIMAAELGVAIDNGPETLLSSELAEFIISEAGCIPQIDTDDAETVDVDQSGWQTRPPVVTIMGHVDHGKTTLLDYLRKTSVAAGEAGGITQHIGAFQVQLPNTSGVVTFLDTPGHAAFTAMRARGAQATDIVVLVIAADDGVMAQTVESIRLAQNANVPIVVAINKCDLHGVDPQKAKTGLLTYGLQLEEFGGEVVGVEISALKGTNIAELQESILVTAELANLRGNFDAPAKGLVLETKVKHGLGTSTTCLITQGTLRAGNAVTSGMSYGNVRFMFDYADRPVKVATPSMPVQLSGWKTLPHAGDYFSFVASEKEAQAIVQQRAKEARDRLSASAISETLLERRRRLRSVVVKLQNEKKALEDKYKDREKSKSQEKAFNHEVFVATQQNRQESRSILDEQSSVPKLCVVLKGDVQGSVDALKTVMSTYRDERVRLACIHSGIGPVAQSDITMAELSKGAVFCLNTDCDKRTQKLADRLGVDVIKHNIIYKLLDLMKEKLDSLVEGKTFVEVVGEAQVKAIFNMTGVEKRHVAGCVITRGKVAKDRTIRVWRKKELVLKKGRLSTLRHLKDDLIVANSGMECGLSVTDAQFEFEDGDLVESFEVREEKESVKWKF